MESNAINLIPLPIIFLDETLNISSWNKSAGKLLSLKSHQHRSISITKVFKQEGLLSSLNYLNAKKGKQAVSVNHKRLRLSLSLIKNEGQGYLLIVENVTKIRHLERMRQDFVANVSHELRTPLTVFHGYLELLMEQSASALSDYKKIFEQMFQQTTRMENLIEDLLLLSRLETDTYGDDRFTMISPVPLLEKIHEDAKALSGKRAHNILLNADSNIKLYGMENSLVSVFSNLVFNAVNYTPEKGTIKISWYKKNKYLYFEVKDTGIGIEKKHIPRLTERFYRVDKDRSRTSGGTGLGLAIVKHVLLLHKATLEIESRLGEGSVFRCIFPDVVEAH